MVGFYVDNGVLKENGAAIQEIGINCGDLFISYSECQQFTPCVYQSRAKYLAVMTGLRARGMRCIRFMVAGLRPKTYETIKNNQATFLANLDQLVADAEANGIRLIPSLFFSQTQIAPFVGETLNKIGVTGSVTQAEMTWFANLVVPRYKNSPAIAYWECFNECDLYVNEMQGFCVASTTSGSTTLTVTSNVVGGVTTTLVDGQTIAGIGVAIGTTLSFGGTGTGGTGTYTLSAPSTATGSTTFFNYKPSYSVNTSMGTPAAWTAADNTTKAHLLNCLTFFHNLIKSLDTAAAYPGKASRATACGSIGLKAKDIVMDGSGNLADDSRSNFATYFAKRAEYQVCEIMGGHPYIQNELGQGYGTYDGKFDFVDFALYTRNFVEAAKAAGKAVVYGEVGINAACARPLQEAMYGDRFFVQEDQIRSALAGGVQLALLWQWSAKEDADLLYGVNYPTLEESKAVRILDVMKTISNSITAQQATPKTPNAVVKLDGTINGIVTIPDHVKLQIADKYTLMIRWRAAVATPAGYLCGRLNSSSNGGYGMYLNTNADGVTVDPHNVPGQLLATQAREERNLNTNDALRWHHQAVVFDGTPASGSRISKTYIDGLLKSSRTNLTNTLTVVSALNFIVGNRTLGSVNTAFNGYVCDLKLYNRVLTDAEIQAAENGETVDSTGLVIDMPMNEGAGTIAVNRAGSGVGDGVLGSGATWIPRAVFPKLMPR